MYAKVEPTCVSVSTYMCSPQQLLCLVGTPVVYINYLSVTYALTCLHNTHMRMYMYIV